MSSLEEKLKRISSELAAYRPQDDAPRVEKKASCLHSVTETALEEASGGLLGAVTEEAVRVVCKTDGLVDWDIARAAFIDTETTGLAGGAGTVAFLVGLGYVSGERFVVEQFFMEDYDVEHEMLSRLMRRLEGFDWLVSFNGKCFDAPLIASRAVLNRIRQPLDGMEQLDLLHAARRIYRKRLRRCNLGNLEKEVLGREREQDIPGALVPVMFFEYLRTGDFEPMKMVLEHNRRDIVSLLTLLCRLCHAVTAPDALAHPDDLWSCGRLHERMGRLEDAERFYLLAEPASNDAAVRRSLLLRRQGRLEEAAALWEQMLEAGGYGPFPALELMKYHEHRTGDLVKALELADICMVQLREQGVRAAGAEDDLTRRRERLVRKLNAKER